MGELRRIVTDDVPVEELPERMRRGLDAGQRVRVTVEAGATAERVPEPRPLRDFWGAGRGLYATPEEAVDFVGKLRDEWED
jgi:hypothetical protein